MRVVAVVSENPSPAQRILTARLTELAQQSSPLPITLIRLHADQTGCDAVPVVTPHLGCGSVAELAASLQQLRYAGGELVFVDCQVAFASVAAELTAAVDTFVVPAEASRRGLDAVTGIIRLAARHDRKLLFALGEAAPSRRTTAACALTLSRFAPLVPAGLLDTATSNAELLQAVHRLAGSEAASDIIQDWAATLSRADGEATVCDVVGVEADSWRVRSAAPLYTGEAVTVTLSMLGRFDATVQQPVEDGAILHLQADAARQQRLAGRLAARIEARIAMTTPATTSSAVPVDAATDDTAPAATPAKRRRVHSLLQRVAAAPAASDRMNGLNRILAERGPGGRRAPGRIIVVGNEKGGSGKSTLTIHLVVSLLKEGFDVATVDLDRRQGSLTRYLENRRAFAEKNGTALLQPSCHTVIDGHDDELRFSNMLMDLSRNRDFVVLDTPGHDQPLSRLAHLFADKVITPINDSFLDLDVIARLDPDTADYVGPSHYGRVMLQARQERGCVNGSPDWIVVRNRLSTVVARNKVEMAAAVERLSQKMGFRVGPGLTERVIFRELFPFGLTLLDLREPGVGVSMTISHVAARQELRALLQVLLPGLETQVPLSQTHVDDRKTAADTDAADLELASA